jgi:5-methylcytosine-specific restriction endonuclease McrA
MRRLRTVDALHLLNSTSLGPVLNDRQLRRHRTRSEEAFYRDGEVDLVAYAAWLVRRFAQTRDGITGSVSTGNVLTLIERQDYRCALTGRTLKPGTMSLDHVLPLSQGGAHAIENVQVLEKEVNRAKGVLTNEQFIALCRAVVAWTDAPKFQKQ